MTNLSSVIINKECYDIDKSEIDTYKRLAFNTPLSELERIADNREARPKLRIKCIKELNRRKALQSL